MEQSPYYTEVQWKNTSEVFLLITSWQTGLDNGVISTGITQFRKHLPSLFSIEKPSFPFMSSILYKQAIKPSSFSWEGLSYLLQKAIIYSLINSCSSNIGSQRTEKTCKNNCRIRYFMFSSLSKFINIFLLFWGHSNVIAYLMLSLSCLFRKEDSLQ